MSVKPPQTPLLPVEEGSPSAPISKKALWLIIAVAALIEAVAALASAAAREPLALTVFFMVTAATNLMISSKLSTYHEHP